MCADVRLVWVQKEDFSSTVREMFGAVVIFQIMVF